MLLSIIALFFLNLNSEELFNLTDFILKSSSKLSLKLSLKLSIFSFSKIFLSDSKLTEPNASKIKPFLFN